MLSLVLTLQLSLHIRMLKRPGEPENVRTVRVIVLTCRDRTAVGAPGLHHQPVADHHSDVAWPRRLIRSRNIKEDQVARLFLPLRNLRAETPLVLGDARDRHPDALVD